MLSVSDLKSLLEVNRILTLPFIVAAYFQQFGFSHFPTVMESTPAFKIVGFLFIVIGVFFALWFVFDLLNFFDDMCGQYKGTLISLVIVSLLTFAVLGFFRPIESLPELNISWFIAAGAAGLYLLDVHKKAKR